jgi:hypothetical protein
MNINIFLYIFAKLKVCDISGSGNGIFYFYKPNLDCCERKTLLTDWLIWLIISGKQAV